MGAGGRVGPLGDFDPQEPFLGFPVHSQVATLLQALLSWMPTQFTVGEDVGGGGIVGGGVVGAGDVGANVVGANDG